MLRSPANLLSLGRLITAPLFAAAILRGRFDLALALAALAVVSDACDGPLARRRGQASAAGGLLDHFADAGFVCCGSAALALRGELPLLLAPLIALAFAQYVWDSRRPGVPGVALRASRLGRWNGIAYYALVLAPLVRDALGLADTPGLADFWAPGWLLVGSTLVSMLSRARTHRRAEGSRSIR